MASIEITLPIVTFGATWLMSTVGLSWTLSRRSRAWDESDRHQKALFGDPDKLDVGVVKQLADLKNDVNMVRKALNAYGDSEATVVENVAKRISEVSLKALHDEAEVKKRILAEGRR
jgi:vacuolar-type H+-ATPase subunit C/Vma6